MSKQTRYLLTVDSTTGAAVKLERLGEAGDLTEVPLSTLSVAPLGVQAAVPVTGAGAQPTPQSLVINIYMGGPQQAAPSSITSPTPIGPGAPGSLVSAVAPGSPGMNPSAVAPGSPGMNPSAVGPGEPAGPASHAAATQGKGGLGGSSGGGGDTR